MTGTRSRRGIRRTVSPASVGPGNTVVVSWPDHKAYFDDRPGSGPPVRLLTVSRGARASSAQHPKGANPAVSNAQRLKVFEQTRAHWGEETAEVLLELVVPVGQDMSAKADLDTAASSMEEYALRTLLLALAPLYLGMIGLSFAGGVSPADQVALHPVRVAAGSPTPYDGRPARRARRPRAGHVHGGRGRGPLVRAQPELPSLLDALSVLSEGASAVRSRQARVWSNGQPSRHQRNGIPRRFGIGSAFPTGPRFAFAFGFVVPF